MSLKFCIKNTIGPAKKEGDMIVRYSGISERMMRKSERKCDAIGEDAKGNPKIVFTTGLEKDKVKFLPWYNDEEKKSLEQFIDEVRPNISQFFNGDDVISPTNKFFWTTNEVYTLSVNVENIGVYFDTNNPNHALLYLSIVAGAFVDTVSPTKDYAERHGIPYYIELDIDEGKFDDEDSSLNKVEAYAALQDLRKNHGKDALYFIAWCLQYDTYAFGAYTYNISEKDLTNYHIKYIEDKLPSKKKFDRGKKFIEYYDKWNGATSKAKLMTEAYIKAGEFYNFIQQKEKKYTTIDGTVLGNTVEDAVTTIMKTKFQSDFEKLRDSVEAKWKE